MKYTLKKDWETDGTLHTISVMIVGKPRVATYVVNHVSGKETFGPNTGEPIVYLELQGRVNFSIQHFAAIPLQVFARRFKPVNKASEFYEPENTKA